MAKTFLGTGWAFPVGIDARGGIRMRSAEDDVKEACRIILGTRLGERVMRPQFGSGLENFVFDHNDANLAGRIEFYVRRALELWEPRVEVQEVRATPQGNRIDIDVRYVVLATNREDNLVFPFFVGDLP